MEWLRECEGKNVKVDGFVFVLDEKTGYYRCNKLRERLHRYIWKKHRGEIPEGFHVHHIDHDKKNNHIDNLAVISHSEHSKHHEDDKQKENSYLEWKKENLTKKARPKASEWHRSKDGREWHKKHAIEVAKNRKCEKFLCRYCNNEFETWNNSRNKFCSNKCKSAWRRKEGLDDEQRKCVMCENSFKVNKYSKTRTCSGTCRAKFNHQNRQTP